MNTKKIVSFFVTAVIAASSLFALVACDNTPKRELEGIEVTTAPTKIKYVEGEKFDTAGMVVSKVYSDESKEALAATDYTYSPSGNLKLTDKKVTITYKADDKSYTASVNISVTNDIASVEVLTAPDKREYVTGEIFDPAGMTIQATYEDGSKDEEVVVSTETVEFKTTALLASDNGNFQMSYGGYTFYYDLKVSCGAFMEAEAGLVVAKGVTIADDGPYTPAIQMDVVNAADPSNGGHRGRDEGDKCTQGDDCTYGSPRVAVTNYVFDHLEWTETTGGTPYGSGRQSKNHIEGKNGGKIMYSLSGDKNGTGSMIFKMANPNITGSVAAETSLNTVIKIYANGQEVAIPDSVKLAGVDWTEYKSYNKTTKKFDGASCVPTYYWQNVAVTVPLVNGGNNITVEFICNGTVRVDSIKFDADEDKVSLFQDCVFAPEVLTASLKVENEKVLMGVVVDAKAVGYTDEAIMTVLGLTTIRSSNASNNWSTNGQPLNDNEGGGNDPWTNTVYNGGLGYTTQSPSHVAGKHNGDYDRNATASVEKIITGDYAGKFRVWIDVTIQDDPKGPTPDTNRYRGAWRFTDFNYGALYANSKPAAAILKDGENVTAELGDYCYQIYCDIRDDNNSFNGGDLMLIVQDGSFSGENARNLLGRRRLSHLDDNDPVPAA